MKGKNSESKAIPKGIPGKHRDYAGLEKSLEDLAKDRFFNLQAIGSQQNSGRKIYILRADRFPGNPRMLISAGTHGSEPAGVLAVREFLQDRIRDWLEHFNFDILPCNNPYGFETGTRRNPEGQDINHSFFKGGQSVEAGLIMGWFNRNGPGYRLSLDLHEDSLGDLGKEFSRADYPGRFYMYESCEDIGKRIGRDIIRAVRQLGFPVSLKRSIYGDRSKGGIIWYPEGRTGKVYKEKITFDDFLLGRFTDHALVIETPTSWDIRTRIDVHKKIIDIALGSST